MSHVISYNGFQGVNVYYPDRELYNFPRDQENAGFVLLQIIAFKYVRQKLAHMELR